MTMKVVAIHLLLVLVAIYKGVQAETKNGYDITDLEFFREVPGSGYHAHGGVQADTKNDDDIIRYINGHTPDVAGYGDFIKKLRSRLASGNSAHNIPVLPESFAQSSQRFIQVQLLDIPNEEEGSISITVIIDSVNVYVMGYLTTLDGGTTFHYLKDPRPEALRAALEAFSQYTQEPLGFAGNYRSLGCREDQDLGHSALNGAICSLHYVRRDRLKSAMLVIVQMISDAARTNYIADRILRSMQSNHAFRPDVRMISVQNKWKRLSEQIQLSGQSGVFKVTIDIKDDRSQTGIIPISNAEESVRYAGLALLLFFKCVPKSNLLIRMPVSVADACSPFEPTTNIIGLDGLCLDSKFNFGDHLKLQPCGNAQPSQLWTFKSDGTIRSSGKCLMRYQGEYDYFISLYNCTTAGAAYITWTLSYIGTIMNPATGRVLTAGEMRAAEDINSTSQAWNAGIYTPPMVNYITGFGLNCLQANGLNERVWLAKCVMNHGGESNQQWAFYGDSTIRLYGDRSLCVESVGPNLYDRLILSNCQAGPNQRWAFMGDGTILNPHSRLVMDVLEADVSLNEIILYTPTGNPNQKWSAI